MASIVSKGAWTSDEDEVSSNFPRNIAVVNRGCDCSSLVQRLASAVEELGPKSVTQLHYFVLLSFRGSCRWASVAGRVKTRNSGRKSRAQFLIAGALIALG